MSRKQVKQIINIVLGVIIGLGVLVGGYFWLYGDEDTRDIDTIKEVGGYELMKSDFEDILRVKSSMSGSLADKFFENIGIKEYQGLEMGVIGKKGNIKITCDGYDFYCMISAGKLGVAYIGNVIIYKDTSVTNSVAVNATEYTFVQYQTLVDSVKRKLKLSDEDARSLYEEMTEMNIMTLSGIKKGKLNGISGYYGTESNITYFFTLNANNKFDKIYVVCDAYDPILIYDILNPKESIGANAVKVLQGRRQGIANVMAYRCTTATGIENISFPSALLTGDDSWLMVRGLDNTIYLEVLGEIKKKDKTQTKKFYIKVNENNELLYLKIGNKVYIDGAVPIMNIEDETVEEVVNEE